MYHTKGVVKSTTVQSRNKNLIVFDKLGKIQGNKICKH